MTFRNSTCAHFALTSAASLSYTNPRSWVWRQVLETPPVRSIKYGVRLDTCCCALQDLPPDPEPGVGVRNARLSTGEVGNQSGRQKSELGCGSGGVDEDFDR